VPEVRAGGKGQHVSVPLLGLGPGG